MRLLLILLFASPLLAQENSPDFPEYLAQGTENIRDQRTGEVDINRVAQAAPTTTQPAAPVQTGLPGFAEIPWKATYSEVKTRLKNLSTAAVQTERVEILMEEKNKSILVRRNEVLYRYNFYRTPVEVLRIANHDLTDADYEQQEGQLFQVRVTFSLIDAAKIQDRIEKSHGAKTKSTVDPKKMEGAEIWELPGGVILEWVEPYRKMKFSRTVDFLSSEMTKQIMKEYEDYFDAREKWIINNIKLY
ncbi:MAG TPA: hypothetical protein PKE49_06905 [Leptospiraceae bacterium]|jgi:hypothetical protein|nr:hypothetical protein [Leptospirales bacterium]HMU82111.1 hypothetical protein [Leptospiraceae bacterium]HMW60987.1 hypothetical protein [Leptospiraceae bacterium]HMX56235.1 hypothetical protein [Leptospiraceae bacterium]HMY47622.1 hypothetical protein [Leptospiraceae bacterium]